jgi:hypothetical protein
LGSGQRGEEEGSLVICEKCMKIVSDTVNKVTRHPTGWEKIFINYSSDRRLIFSIHKERGSKALTIKK